MRKSTLIWLAAWGVAVTGCAKQGDVGHTAVAPVASGLAGTILTLRTVAGSDTQEPWRAALLADTTTSTVTDTARLTEFIVHADNGATLSIVQPNVSSFHQGERVIILQDNRARLLPSK